MATLADLATRIAQDINAVRDVAQATDAGVANLLTSGEQTAPLLAAKVNKGEIYVEAADFGAVGDGIADDTAALQAWLDAPGPVRRLHDGTYRITAGLTSSEPGRRIICDGATIIAGATMSAMLWVTGDGSSITPNLDGGNLANRGVLIDAAGCEVAWGKITRLRSTTGQAVGIRATTLGGIHVHHNTITDVTSVGDTTTGNDNGAARGITVSGIGASPALAESVVEHNRIERILGEEGDAIHIAFSNNPGVESMTRVSDNHVANVSRRMVKVQASGAMVARNTYRHDGPAPQNPSTLIDIQYSSNCQVIDNVIDGKYFRAIGVTGTAEIPAKDTLIEGNLIRGGDANQGIACNSALNVIVRKNIVNNCLTGISFGGSAALLVEDNTLTGGLAAWHAGIKVDATCTGAVVRRNVAIGGPRTMLVNNESPGALVEGNVMAVAGAVANSAASSTGSVYRDNLALVSGWALMGTFTGQVVSATPVSGVAKTDIAGDIFWSSGIPSTTLPTRQSTKGDIAFSSAPTAGGTAGWVCVTAGTPGTWKPFATIAA